jgi:hypothetical protein
VSAALVEAYKYLYVYGATTQQQLYGEHQVVDLGLSESGSGVLGAALLDVEVEGHSGASRLLVLTEDQVLELHL